MSLHIYNISAKYLSNILIGNGTVQNFAENKGEITNIFPEG
jgi:hypothetical protein